MLRQAILWTGCAVLTVGLVVAEDWAAGAAYFPPRTTPITVTPIDTGTHVTPRIVVVDTEAISDARYGESGTDSARPHAARQEREPRKVRRICRVTAYCDRGTTAAGIPSGVGQCAAPLDIPFGSKVYIPAMGRTLTVTDRTHRRFRHNTVDIFIPSKKACRKFGRRYLECEFIVVDEPPAYGKVRVAR